MLTGVSVMRAHRSSRVVALAAALVGLLALAGCSTPTVIEDSSVTVAMSRAFFSLNDRTSYGNSPANSQVLQATSSRFAAYDENSELVADTSFGTYQLLSNDPLTVRYTIANDVTWSDGVPVDAADLLLAWVANSGALNTKDFDDGPYIDEETGRYAEPFPSDVVHFDGATSEGLQYVTEMPEIGDDGRSLTLTWDRYFVDWPLVLEVGLPAHVVATKALKLTPTAVPDDETGAVSDADRVRDGETAKAALVEAIQEDDTAELSAIANVWNSGFNLERLPDDPSLLVSNGPYTITGFEAGDHLVLSANPNYRGDHRPVFETIRVRFMADPLAQVQALADGEVDVVTPRPNPDVVDALRRIAGGAAPGVTASDEPDREGAHGVTVLDGVDGTYEHLDLKFANSKNGSLDDRRVREAFLKVVPWRAILDAMVTPVLGEAQPRASQLFFPGAPGYEGSVADNGSRSLERVDVPGAKALLAEAGVAKPVVCIMFDPANPRRQEEFKLIRESASDAGFAVTNCSSPDWLNLLSTLGTYDASLFSWRVTNLSFTGIQAIYLTDGLSNLNDYSNPEVDALLATLSVTVDPAKQLELRQQIDAILFEDSYGLPLYQNPVIVAHDDSVSGIGIAPLAPGIFWNVWEWMPVVEASPSPSG
ncbi:ABC transporter family substrate-binding protein [Leifsonia bigeumensis]|uniref:ABC transporter family substrate-binding protein n=2 Tax=Leifsonella bigeumensis TaxID=433643 RepID=A0ABP7FIN8_9MICO